MMKPKLIKSSIALLIICLIVLAGFMIWNGSILGKALPTPVKPTNSSPLVQVTPGKPSAQQPDLVPATPETTNSDEPTIASQEGGGDPVCGGPPVMQILALGVDPQEQTDAIRLVRVDFVTQQVSVLSIPRDLWVPIPGFTEHGINEYRINAAYGYGEYFNGKGGGVVSFANTLYANYDITFDHYVVVHFDSFEKIIDQIGGVDITLDQPVDGTLQTLPYFSTGTHHLDGATALQFSRIRYPDNDAHRVDRQTMVIQSVIAKLKDPANFKLIPGLAISFLTDKSLITDLSLNDVSTLVCLTKKFDADSVTFHSIPAEMYTPTKAASGFFYDLPSPSVAQFVQDFWNGVR